MAVFLSPGTYHIYKQNNQQMLAANILSKELGLKFQRRFFQYSIQAIKKPNWLLMFVLGRIAVVRRFALSLSKRPFTKDYGLGSSFFEQLDVDHVVKILKQDGLYILNLPNNLLGEILDFSRNAIYFGDGNPNFCFLLADKEKIESKCGKKFRFAYNLNPSLLCPAINQLENDPKLWEIAAKYLETNPILIGTHIWWTFAIEEAADEPRRGSFRFHYDLDDYRSLKFMFYLTDVDLSSSSHICVKGSHNKKKLKEQISLFRDRDDKEIIDYYGSENVINICGSAGLGFAEDPYCFHRGTIPVGSKRLILEVKFASNNYEFEPKKNGLW